MDQQQQGFNNGRVGSARSSRRETLAKNAANMTNQSRRRFKLVTLLPLFEEQAFEAIALCVCI
jgi:hypothetical protein